MKNLYLLNSPEILFKFYENNNNIPEEIFNNIEDIIYIENTGNSEENTMKRLSLKNLSLEERREKLNEIIASNNQILLGIVLNKKEIKFTDNELSGIELEEFLKEKFILEKNEVVNEYQNIAEKKTYDAFLRDVTNNEYIMDFYYYPGDSDAGYENELDVSFTLDKEKIENIKTNFQYFEVLHELTYLSLLKLIDGYKYNVKETIVSNDTFHREGIGCYSCSETEMIEESYEFLATSSLYFIDYQNRLKEFLNDLKYNEENLKNIDDVEVKKNIKFLIENNLGIKVPLENIKEFVVHLLDDSMKIKEKIEEYQKENKIYTSWDDIQIEDVKKLKNLIPTRNKFNIEKIIELLKNDVNFNKEIKNCNVPGELFQKVFKKIQELESKEELNLTAEEREKITNEILMQL